MGIKRIIEGYRRAVRRNGGAMKLLTNMHIYLKMTVIQILHMVALFMLSQMTVALLALIMKVKICICDFLFTVNNK